MGGRFKGQREQILNSKHGCLSGCVAACLAKVCRLRFTPRDNFGINHNMHEP